jgi:hypothetical protein
MVHAIRTCAAVTPCAAATVSTASLPATRPDEPPLEQLGKSTEVLGDRRQSLLPQVDQVEVVAAQDAQVLLDQSA